MPEKGQIRFYTTYSMYLGKYGCNLIASSEIGLGRTTAPEIASLLRCTAFVKGAEG